MKLSEQLVRRFALEWIDDTARGLTPKDEYSLVRIATDETIQRALRVCQAAKDAMPPAPEGVDPILPEMVNSVIDAIARGIRQLNLQ